MKGMVSFLMAAWMVGGMRAAPLPGEPCTQAAPLPYPFPDPLSAFVARNWGLVAPEKLAAMLQVAPGEICRVAGEMALPTNGAACVGAPCDRFQLLRRNWAVLNYNRLETLLGVSRTELAALLAGKEGALERLGGTKPKCPEIFATPEVIAGGRASRLRLAEILRAEGLSASGLSPAPAADPAAVRAYYTAVTNFRALSAAALARGDVPEMKRLAAAERTRAKAFYPRLAGGVAEGPAGPVTAADVLEEFWHAQGICAREKFALPKTCKDGRRPYEMVWANRRTDEVPPVDPLTSADHWQASGTQAVARVSTADDRLLFGDGVLRLDYRATGRDPVVSIVRRAPLALPPFDTFSVWVYGNTFYGRTPGTPMTQLAANFTDDRGKPFSLHVATLLHREWSKFQKKVPQDLLARTRAGGCRFTGFTLKGGTNTEERRLDFTSVCAFVEEWKPLAFAPRPKRGIRVFGDQPQGANTGEGRLPFPTVETTVVPPAEKEDGALEFRTPEDPAVWDDLAFRIGGGDWVPLARGGGVWPRAAGKGRAKVTWRRIGNSLVADIVVTGGAVEEVRFGGLGLELDAKSFPIPYYTYGHGGWDDRPQVAVAELKEGTRFVSATLDWTQSNASEPFPPCSGTGDVAVNGGARYRPKTDGTRNDVYERFVWTVSPRFEDALPFIPNPPSPWKHVTGRSCWITSGASRDRSPNLESFFWHHRNGLRRLIVTDHETGWRDADESFTFRTDPAPGRGGDRGQFDYARKLIDGFGFRYGPYNNFTDYAPVNGYWRSDYVGRLSDGNWQGAWARCTGPKPLYALEMCARLAPVNQAKFRFNTAYCDVHTAVSPWSRTDYDARVPGAGTFAQTFYAYGEIMLIQKKTWGGPVSSEGRHQWLYSGLTDHNYAQDPSYQFMHHPWIADFALRRMHPLTCDFGPFASMFFGDNNVPKSSPWAVVEPWTAHTLAFGNAAFLLPENPTYAYYMILAPASRYTQENVRAIRYGDGKGNLLTTSEAALAGALARNQLAVRYDGGTEVTVNGDFEGRFFVQRLSGGTLVLPQWGFLVTGGDVVAYSGWARGGTNRVDFCRGGAADGYIYMNGRGTFTAFPGGATDGAMVRLMETENTEEVIPWGSSACEIALPYAAVRVTGLSGAMRQPVKEIPCRIDEKGWTHFKRARSCYSYRVVRPRGFREPSAATYARWALRPKDFKVPPVAAAKKPFTLPDRFLKGLLALDGAEKPFDPASGAYVRQGASACGGVSRFGLAMHPPFQNGVRGAVYARYTLTPSAGQPLLKAKIGKVDHSTPGDGILFKVGVRCGDDPLKIIAEHRVCEHRWEEISADLAPYAGKRIFLYLISDPGGNTYGDGNNWAEVTFLSRRH